MQLSIRQCLPSDLHALQAIGRETYNETFGAMNCKETIDKYLEQAFSLDKLAVEFANPACQFFFLYADEQLVGYLKVNEAPAQSDINDASSLEVERIYVRKQHKGKGLGKVLMNHALKLAIQFGKDYVWLGVWEENRAAIEFYKKMGFEEFGQHFFKMGDEHQSDLVMRKNLIVSH